MFDFNADIYGRHARVTLVDFLRPEQKFDGIDALKAQIGADSEQARATLAWEGIDDAWPSSSFLGDGPE
jgi:riboflavin kinase/FMN adenylyltransferase